jgi:hypothetical protein
MTYDELEQHIGHTFLVQKYSVDKTVDAIGVFCEQCKKLLLRVPKPKKDNKRFFNPAPKSEVKGGKVR